MIRFAADENFDNHILRGIRKRDPSINIVRIQDASLRGAKDPVILDWAAREGRILLTHDAATMLRFAYQRVDSGLPMPGVFLVRELDPVGPIIEDLLLLAACSLEGEWEGRVEHLPLKR